MSICTAHTPLMGFSWLRKGYWTLVRSCHSLEVKMQIDNSLRQCLLEIILFHRDFRNIWVNRMLIYHSNSTQHWGAVREGHAHPAPSIREMVQMSMGFRKTFHYLRMQWRNEMAVRHKKQKVETQRSQQLDDLFQLLLTEEPLFDRAEVFPCPWKKKFKAKSKMIGLNISKIFTKGNVITGYSWLSQSPAHPFCLHTHYVCFIICHIETTPPHRDQKMLVIEDFLLTEIFTMFLFSSHLSCIFLQHCWCVSLCFQLC